MILAAFYHGILAFFFAVVAILLMIVILLQRGKGVGLAGAFGGTGGSSAFGAKTGDFLTWVTVIGAGIFLLFTILLNYVFVPGPPVLPTTPGSSGTTPGGTPAAPPGGSGGLWHLEQPADAPNWACLAIFGESRA